MLELIAGAMICILRKKSWSDSRLWSNSYLFHCRANKLPSRISGTCALCVVHCSWQSKEATNFKPWMSSTVGSAAVATSDTLGNTSDAVNDHISKPDKEHVRRASLPCIWDSSIWSFVRYTCENSWYCSDSTCHTLNSGNSYLSHRRGKPRRGRSGTALCLDRRTDGKRYRSKSQTWCHIPYNVTRHLAVYHTDCTWFVEPSSSLTHEFSQLHRGKSDKGISCYNMEPEKNISSHNAHNPPCFSLFASCVCCDGIQAPSSFSRRDQLHARKLNEMLLSDNEGDQAWGQHCWRLAKNEANI